MRIRAPQAPKDWQRKPNGEEMIQCWGEIVDACKECGRTDFKGTRLTIEMAARSLYFFRDACDVKDKAAASQWHTKFSQIATRLGILGQRDVDASRSQKTDANEFDQVA